MPVRPDAAPLEIGGAPQDAGWQPIGEDLWARGAGAAAVGSPDVVSALAGVPFDHLAIGGGQITLIWGPSLEEYQAEFGQQQQPQQYAHAIRQGFSALLAVSNRLGA